MLPRRRNPCVYTGPVGAPMRPPSAKPRKAPVEREAVTCVGGPLAGETIQLERNSGLTTLAFTLHGLTGRYVAGAWKPQ